MKWNGMITAYIHIAFATQSPPRRNLDESKINYAYSIRRNSIRRETRKTPPPPANHQRNKPCKHYNNGYSKALSEGNGDKGKKTKTKSPPLYETTTQGAA